MESETLGDEGEPRDQPEKEGQARHKNNRLLSSSAQAIRKKLLSSECRPRRIDGHEGFKKATVKECKERPEGRDAFGVLKPLNMDSFRFFSQPYATRNHN